MEKTSSKKFIVIIFAILAVILIILAWAPWFSADKAEGLINLDFDKKWGGVSDGCGKYDGLTGRLIPNTVEIKKIPFGYWGRIGYQCGMLPAGDDTSTYKPVFVSFYGTAYGIK